MMGAERQAPSVHNTAHAHPIVRYSSATAANNHESAISAVVLAFGEHSW